MSAQTPFRTGAERTARIIVTTANDVPAARVVEVLGVVRGIVVRSPNIGQGLIGSLRSLAGGNIPEFAKVCEEARHQAYAQMLEHAEALKADAVVGMRYDATEFMQGATEVLAYGTAVRIAATR